MTAGAKGQVRRRGTLADHTVAVVLVLLLHLAHLDTGCTGIPAVGVPLERLGEVLLHPRSDTSGGEKGVGCWDDEVGVGDGHRRLDLAEDRVDGSVEAEGLLEDGLVQCELADVLVGQGREVGAQNTDLLLVEFLDDIGAGGEVKHHPGAGRRRRVLAGHEHGNHHVCNLLVGDRGAVLVNRCHKMADQVVLILIRFVSSATGLDDLRVCLGKNSLGAIASTVLRQRSPVKHEVDWGESHVEVVEEVGKYGVESGSDFLSLEGTGSGIDGDLRHGCGKVGLSAGALECWAGLDEVGDLVDDKGHVGLECLGGKTDFHELRQLANDHFSVYLNPYLLLLHELRVGAVVDNSGTENWGGEFCVDLLGVHVLEFAIKDELVASSSQVYGRLLSEKDKGEDIAILLKSAWSFAQQTHVHEPFLCT